MDWRQRKAIEKTYREALIREFPRVDFRDESGIYVFQRTDEETGLRFAYVGQAKNVMNRLVQHCMGFDSHIDKSLKKRKFWNDQNRGGWLVDTIYYAEEMLDEKGKPDYAKLKPVLFEMPTYKYLRTGDIIGDCVKMGKAYGETLK